MISFKGRFLILVKTDPSPSGEALAGLDLPRGDAVLVNSRRVAAVQPAQDTRVVAPTHP